MRIAFIARSTLFDVPGGDTIQVMQTASHLEKLGVVVDILKSTNPITYESYDLLHFFNITRPADILYHTRRTNKPFALSPILVDYNEYDRNHRRGLSGFFLRLAPPGMNEYIKTVARWLKGSDMLQSKDYLWKGQRKSMQEVLEKTAVLLPNSEGEYNTLNRIHGNQLPGNVIPNGIDTAIFQPAGHEKKDEHLVLCVARIEGLKNQLNLIRAMNDTTYTLLLIGLPAPNQQEYYKTCKKMAADNIFFSGHMTQQELVSYYSRAKVHVLPAWFETCGLSSLEAAAMGCNIVITDKGYTREYFGDDAFYCDPGSPESIFNAVDKAAKAPVRKSLQQKILSQYTWKKAAAITYEAYQKILSHEKS